MSMEKCRVSFSYRKVKGRDRWQADLRWTDPDTGDELGRVRPSCFRSEDEVYRWGVAAQAALLAGEPLPPTPGKGQGRRSRAYSAGPRLSDALALTTELFWKDAKASETLIKNAEDVIEILDDLPLSKLRQDHVLELVRKLQARNLSKSTINRKISAFSKMINVMREYETIDIPHVSFSRMKEPPSRLRFFSIEEETQILTWLAANGYEEFADFIQLLIETGLRLSEMLNLRWKDVKMPKKGGGHINVWRSKTNTASMVPLSDTARDILEARAKRCRRAPNQKVWPENWTPDKCNHWWTKMRKAIGMDHDKQFVIHTCRHTFCSRLAQQGVSMPIIKELAGHSAVATTVRYTHPDEKSLKRSIRQMSRAREESPDLVSYLCAAAFA